MQEKVDGMITGGTQLEKEIELTQGLANRLARRLSKTREGAANPDAPACSTSSILQCGGETGIRTLEPLRVTRFPGVPFQPLTHLA